MDLFVLCTILPEASAQSMALSRVQLVLSPVGTLFPVQGYHTSILIGKTEYVFGAKGVLRADGPQSHKALGYEDREYIDFGNRFVDVPSFESTLFPLFRAGTYDLLRRLVLCRCRATR